MANALPYPIRTDTRTITVDGETIEVLWGNFFHVDGDRYLVRERPLLDQQQWPEDMDYMWRFEIVDAEVQYVAQTHFISGDRGTPEEPQVFNFNGNTATDIVAAAVKFIRNGSK